MQNTLLQASRDELAEHLAFTAELGASVVTVHMGEQPGLA
jgi:endonuclease IV